MSDLQDRDVDETVKTLLEATTERLVLVSTPENSQEVRFDVRQFQEFFAAEYISNPRDTALLQRRVEVIIDDSHWREVIHFLVSGLVELDRLQDLAIVAHVIISVDQGCFGQSDPVLGAQLAIGARITARLLFEGVLESDRRLRQQFRAHLLPLMAATDGWELLAKVRPPHSLAWLADLLLEELQRLKSSEGIGSSAALAGLGTLEPVFIHSLCAEVLASSPSYQACFIELITRFYNSRLYNSDVSVPMWLGTLIVSLLLQHDWFNIESSGIASIFNLGRMNPKIIDNALTELALPQPACDLIRMSFEQPEFLGGSGADIHNLHGLLEA